MKNILSTKQDDTILDIRKQKEEMLANIRHEKKLMKKYSDGLLLPFKEHQKYAAANLSPIGRITQKIAGVRYAYKVCKGLFTIIRSLR